MTVNLGKRYRHYIDTETTGLDPSVHELLEVAIVTEEVSESAPFERAVTTTWSAKILPERIHINEPKALEVNGYTPEKWASAVPFSEVAQEIADKLKDGVIVGHNVRFDLDFLGAEFKRAGIDPKLPYHNIDTVTLAYEHWSLSGECARVSLDPLRVHLGLTLAQHHSAVKDAMDCREVFYRAMRPSPGRFFQRVKSMCLRQFQLRWWVFRHFLSFLD